MAGLVLRGDGGRSQYFVGTADGNVMQLKGLQTTLTLEAGTGIENLLFSYVLIPRLFSQQPDLTGLIKICCRMLCI
jgi:hypothetical protein